MKMYVVYKNPKDYPGKYVLRAFTFKGLDVVPDKKPIIVDEDLHKVREMIPSECTGITRSGGDDPVILETWL